MFRLGRIIGVTAALGLALSLAACQGAGPSVAPPALASGVVAVEAKEYAFTPSTLTVPAGEVTFAVKNGGTEEHEFEVFKGETVVDEVEGLVPGLTKPLTVTLEPGEYAYMCKINGHDILGMKGTLIVN